MKKVNILLTGCGAPGAPGIIKSLRLNGEREIRIIGTDIRNENAGVPMVDKFYRVPMPESQNFIDCILKICKNENIDVVLPLVTRELFKFSEYKSFFRKKGVVISVSDSKGLFAVNDKANLLEAMKKYGSLVPEYRIINCFKEFEEAVRELGYPEKEVCFKPAVSNGSRGFRIITDKIDKFDLLFNYKPNTTYTSYSDLAEIIRSKNIPKSLIMEYLPFEEYSIDMLVDNGKAIFTIPRIRNEMRLGISIIGMIERNKEIIDYCNKIAVDFYLHGNIGVQVKKGRDGKFKILEVNPRVQGTIVVNTAAGVNLPYFAVKLALEEPVPEVNVEWGTKVFRFYDEYFKIENKYFKIIR